MGIPLPNADDEVSSSSRFSSRMSRMSMSRNSQGDVQPTAADEEADVELAITRTLWRNHRLIPPNSAFLRYWFSMIISLVLVRAARARSAHCLHLHAPRIIHAIPLNTKHLHDPGGHA